jgi:hypothetical protein
MENKPNFRPNPKIKLMDQVYMKMPVSVRIFSSFVVPVPGMEVREVLRYHHYAYRTEQTYCQWILRYIHPQSISILNP